MSIIRFGEFEFNEQTLELRKNGSLTRIQQQPARVLAFLLNHRGGLVTREQIRLAIWGEDTFVDFEQGLNFCIRQIRLALNDKVEHPLHIETLPRLGYRFIGPIKKNEDGETPQAEKRIRIAVVPIEDLSGQSEGYFAAGLTEDMISALSRIDPQRLRVTAGPRSIRGADTSAEQLEHLGRALDLDFLLRGTVRRSADKIRICAQLHDLRDKSVLWSQTYDFRSADLLAVQEEVTYRVSRSLALEIFPSATVGSRRYARSAAAYDAYLKGRFFWHKMTRDGLTSSIAYFSEAITIDADFAPAYAGLADSYAQMGTTRVGIMKPMEALAKALPNLKHAMDLDQTLAEAHCTTGMLNCWYGLDWPSVGRNFHIALSLAPTQITALLWQSLYFQAMGRHEQSIASARRARESEPLSPITNMYLGVAFMNSGQCDLAIRQLKQAIELDPQTYRPHMFLGIAYQLLGRYEDATNSFRKALSMNPENLESIGYSGVMKAKQGDRRGALEVVDQLKKTERTDPSNMIPLIYASLGEDVEVFRWLELARDRRSAPIYLFLLDPKFRDYESHPKYRSFCDSIGLHRCATA